jgi:uncharacterized pyridoxamine 5'-phosphate oxidase family protein
MTQPAHVLLLCAQGATVEAELNASIGAALQKASGRAVTASVVSLRKQDAEAMQAMAPDIDVRESFEEFRGGTHVADLDAEVARLARDYTDVNWWLIAAGERNIIDASFLVGGLGQRVETRAYVEALIVHMVRYYEAVFASGDFVAAMCPEADSLITYVFYQVARKFGVRILCMSPNAWIREEGRPGFFLCRDEFLHSDRMEEMYRQFGRRGATKEESERVERFKRSVVDFDVKKEFLAATKQKFVVPSTSPQLNNLFRYLRENAARDKDVEYYKIDIWAKTKANILRSWRRWRSKHLIGTPSTPIPPRSVFYGMQYQPEQTTLVGGNLFANQIATIENIAKCLPFGYTLVVKEHPRGRGARPAWQYRHLAHYPNIEFCDADSKDILRRCEATVTITGTIGLEAMALDKPVFVLGNVYYDIADIVYKPKSWPDLARALHRVLIEREYENNTSRHELIDRFFLSYLVARVPVYLSKDSAREIAQALIDELGVPSAQAVASR